MTNVVKDGTEIREDFRKEVIMWILALLILIIMIGYMPMFFVTLIGGTIVVFLVCSYFEYRRMKKDGTWEEYKKTLFGS